MNRNCKRPSLGETENIVDVSVRNNLVAVLSSPKDALKWCSAFISVFRYDSEKVEFSPLHVFELSGSISGFVEWVEDNKGNAFLTAPIYDKGSIDVIYFPSGERLNIDTGIFDVRNFGSGDNSLFIFSTLEKNLTFIYDFSLFLESKGQNGKYRFSSFPSESKNFIIGEFGGDKKLISPLAGKDEIFILPDNRNLKVEFPLNFSEVTAAEKSGGENVSGGEAVVSGFAEKSIFPENSDGVSSPKISLSGFISYSSGFFFIPASLNFQGNSENKQISGIIAVRKSCMEKYISEGMQISQISEPECFWFLVNPDEPSNSEILFFSSKGEYLENGSDIVFAFVEKKKINGEEKSFIYLWFFGQESGVWAFIDKKELLLSPFYEFIEFDISYKKNTDVSGNSGSSQSEKSSSSDRFYQSVSSVVGEDESGVEVSGRDKFSGGDNTIQSNSFIPEISLNIVILVKLNVGEGEKMSFILYKR